MIKIQIVIIIILGSLVALTGCLNTDDSVGVTRPIPTTPKSTLEQSNATDLSVKFPVGGKLDAPSQDLKIPDFSLPSTNGELITLSQYYGNNPINLIFYRGFF